MKKVTLNQLAKISSLATMLSLAHFGYAKTEITLFYPVQVGGALTNIMDEYVAQFESLHPNIDVNPVYSGNYLDTTTKALTAAKSGEPPTVAVLLSVDAFTMIDEDVVEPLDSYIQSEEDKAWLDGFMPAYINPAKIDNQLWSIPFQRSTAVLYWNKDAFKAANLDPEKYPTTWDEMVEMSKALTKKDENGNITQWGVGIPGNASSAYWLMGALAAQNGSTLSSSDGTEVYFNDPKVIEALQYWVDLSQKHGIHPPGIQEWGTTPSDFLEGRIAMIWTTTGNLTNIKNNAKFEFGLAPYPGNKAPASVLGGGNLYLFKDSSEEKKAAGFELIKFLTSDDKLADWGVKTGYIAPRDGSWQTDTLKNYVKENPYAEVARKQIAVSYPELSTHENSRVQRILDDAIAAALTGSKSAEDALNEAQEKADKILRQYR